MIKITVLMNVYNSDEYLFYSLSSIYDMADQIIIVDGAYNSKMPSSFSTDETSGIVQNHPDPSGKIIYRTACSDTQIEQRNKVWEKFSGDWLFIVDDDEVYKKNEISQLKEFLSNAEQDAYKINANVFVNSFGWFYKYPYKRLFRYKPDLHFVVPNELGNSDGPLVPKETIPNLAMYHYAYVKRKSKLRIKEIQRGFKLNWKGKWLVPRGKVSKFTGEHPEIMRDHSYRKIKWDGGEINAS